jgi:hypothetical protein
VDKLIRVWRKDGRETWILIHIEVQSQRDPRFPLRMFQYASRIQNRYKRLPVSLAILGDEFPDWRPIRFVHRRWGSGLVFRFLTFKLLDLTANADALQTHSNFFATVAEAHLAAITTRKDPNLLFAEKVRLVRRLYERGLSSDNIRRLFDVIDYLIRLNPESSRQFRIAHNEIEKEMPMRVLTQSEELAAEEALAAGIASILEARFGSVQEELVERLKVTDLKDLRDLTRTAAVTESLAAFAAALAETEPEM